MNIYFINGRPQLHARDILCSFIALICVLMAFTKYFGYECAIV